MRARTGCEACRERHIKCVRVPEADKCEKCLENRRDCTNSSVHRFKAVKTFSSKTHRDHTNQRSIKHDAGQVWVEVPSVISFVSGNGDDVGADASVPSLASSDDFMVEADADLGRGNADTEHIANDNLAVQRTRDVGQSTGAVDTLNVALAHTRQYPGLQVLSEQASHMSNHTSPQQGTSSPDAIRNLRSPQGGTRIEFLHRTASRDTGHHVSPTGLMPSPQSSMRPGMLGFSPALQASPTYSLTATWPFHSAREAKLFHHYIKHISPWIDVLDASGYFGVEIPRRAAFQPLIANAIYALSALHQSLLEGTEDRESPHYVDESLQHLKQILEDPLGHLDENLLAGVILLRSHEEMSDRDDNVHLLGGSRLLNSIASYAADGGFKESASWISLRQHIYISLTRQTPLGLKLSNYEHSSVFDDQTDEAWANRAVFLLACVLNYAFGSEESTQQSRPGTSVDRWAELMAKVEEWNTSKPWYFSALWNQDEEGVRCASGSSWPEVLTSHPAHAVGLQYYALSKIVLTLYDSRLSELGFGSHKVRKAAETIILRHLRLTVGIAVSNPDVTNAMFQASHILAACGSYLHDPKDQDAAVAFLNGMQKSMGWRTTSIIEELHEQWKN